MTNQDREYKKLLKLKRKEVICNIHWAIEANYRCLANNQMGFMLRPTADSVPIFGTRNFPSLFLLFYTPILNGI